MTEEYTKELMKRFRKPKFAKRLKKVDGVGQVGNPRCGDIMKLEIQVDEKTKKIKDIGFQTFGCPAAVASSDVVCELAKGKTLDQAKNISKEQVVAKLKGMPLIKVHCSILGTEALKKSIDNYNQNISLKGGKKYGSKKIS